MTTELKIETIYRVRINGALHEFSTEDEARAEVRRLKFAARLTEHMLHLNGSAKTAGENCLANADAVISLLCQYRAGGMDPATARTHEAKLLCLDMYKKELEREREVFLSGK